jgi:hypothetical protein
VGVTEGPHGDAALFLQGAGYGVIIEAPGDEGSVKVFGSIGPVEIPIIDEKGFTLNPFAGVENARAFSESTLGLGAQFSVGIPGPSDGSTLSISSFSVGAAATFTLQLGELATDIYADLIGTSFDLKEGKEDGGR